MNLLAELLLKKSLDECTTDELLHITEKYPYFNAGHLLVAAKTNLPNQKAALHFHPLQLSALINKSGNVIVTGKEPIQATIKPPVIETIIEKLEEVNSLESIVGSSELAVSGQQTLVVEDLPVTSNSQPATDNRSEANDEQPATNNLQPVFVEAPAGKPETINKHDSQLPTTDSELSFEPFHTVDYFASQGIKIKLEDNPPDKLSRQLKSFTEWLKTMKKLPDVVANVPVNAPSEKKVEQLAETSLSDSSVETEAMAEVWAKQGNPEKAIEIYRKLSLLEPSKSPYFASLISALKIN